MFDASCIFCKIIQGKIPSTVIMQNDYVLVVRDIAPKAPVHYLIIPKKHIKNITELTEQDQIYAWNLLTAARDLSHQIGKEKGFNVVVNNGADAGQSVFHLHLHFLSGKNITGKDIIEHKFDL